MLKTGAETQEANGNAAGPKLKHLDHILELEDVRLR
jgi:hypothetical protein